MPPRQSPCPPERRRHNAFDVPAEAPSLPACPAKSPPAVDSNVSQFQPAQSPRVPSGKPGDLCVAVEREVPARHPKTPQLGTARRPERGASKSQSTTGSFWIGIIPSVDRRLAITKIRHGSAIFADYER